MAKRRIRRSARSAAQIAASRRNLAKARAKRWSSHKPSAKTRRRAKTAAKAVGIVGLVAAGGYAAHKGSGSKLIVSGRTPTVHHHISGRAQGHTGLSKNGRTLTYMHRNVKGDKHIVYAAGINGAFGKKIGGGPRTVTRYKPQRAMVHPSAFKKNNYAHTEEAKRARARRFRHSKGHVQRSGISEAEALRRANSYTSMRESVSGKRVSAAERTKALRKYRKQAR